MSTSYGLKILHIDAIFRLLKPNYVFQPARVSIFSWRHLIKRHENGRDSFFVRIMSEWNNLPSYVVAQPTVPSTVGWKFKTF